MCDWECICEYVYECVIVHFCGSESELCVKMCTCDGVCF